MDLSKILSAAGNWYVALLVPCVIALPFLFYALSAVLRFVLEPLTQFGN